MLAKLSQAGRQLHYQWIEFVFAPQLEGLDKTDRARLRAELIVACDVQTWWVLAHDLKLGRAEVKTILTGMVERAVTAAG